MRRYHLSLIVLVSALLSLAALTGHSGHSSYPAHAAAPPEPLKSFISAPWPEMDALFQRDDGWIGGDGGYSVALSGERTLWLFSDTWVGKIQNGKRTDATIVNNTAAWQDGRGVHGTMQFFVRRDANGKPTALITPANGGGWFWLAGGALVNSRLYLFLPQFEKKGEGAFGFVQVGAWLGVVENPQAPPTDWKVEQRRLPFAILTAQRVRTFGAAVLPEDGFLYVYGTDERRQSPFPDRRLVVARVPVDRVEQFGEWRFCQNGLWTSNVDEATRMAPGMGSEGSVSYLSRIHRYVLIYTELGLSDRILARTARQPWGPWSDAVELYRCPEMVQDKRLFCYGAKAHPSQGADDELVVTYFVNSTDFWQVAKDARLYWPRFVRVRIRD